MAGYPDNLIEILVHHEQGQTRIRLACLEETPDMVIWYEDDEGGNDP